MPPLLGCCFTPPSCRYRIRAFLSCVQALQTSKKASILGADIHDPNARTSMTQGGAKKTLGGKSGHVRPRQGTEICNFGAVSTGFLDFLQWIFLPFLQVLCAI